MTFKKPKNVRYVDMCIYVDEKIEKSATETLTEEEQNKCFEYIYHIIYMLSIKKRFFNKESYYDEFSLTLATDVYNRLFINHKLDELDEFGNPKMVRIKSCLNYIKAVLYGRKVSFEQQNYSQKVLNMSDINEEDDFVCYTTSSYILDDMSFDLTTNVEMYLTSISSDILNYIQTNTPYKHDCGMIRNLYISCMISILNGITFTKKDFYDIQTKYTTPEAKFNYLCKMFKQNRDNSVTLYHLDDIYKDYVTVLLRKIYSLIAKGISSMCKSSISIPENLLLNMAYMEIIGKESENEH